MLQPFALACVDHACCRPGCSNTGGSTHLSQKTKHGSSAQPSHSHALPKPFPGVRCLCRVNSASSHLRPAECSGMRLLCIVSTRGCSMVVRSLARMGKHTHHAFLRLFACLPRCDGARAKLLADRCAQNPFPAACKIHSMACALCSATACTRSLACASCACKWKPAECSGFFLHRNHQLAFTSNPLLFVLGRAAALRSWRA